MAYMLLHHETDDYDGWKERFDADPAGRAEVAKAYQIFRGVDDPTKVFIGVEFASVEDLNRIVDLIGGRGEAAVGARRE